MSSQARHKARARDSYLGPHAVYDVEGFCRANSYGALRRFSRRAYGAEYWSGFKQQTGDEFRGHTGGSQELAKEVKEGALQGDVFISADPKVNALLSGPTNADKVKWYVTFAESPLVLGVSAAEAKGKSWDEVLMQPGVKIGRTDPAKDPKGALTVEFLKKADKPELAKSVLEHSSVLPESACEEDTGRRNGRGFLLLDRDDGRRADSDCYDPAKRA